jgi:ribosomal protein L30/L7E
MIAVVRIAGQVKQKREVKETLARLNLPRKFSCVVIDGRTRF